MAWYNFYMNNDPNAPIARECHSIHTFGTNLLLFGGNNERLRMDDVHILDTLTMKWSRLPPEGEAPVKRSAHSSALVDNRYMYVFGGWNGSTELGDISVFDLVMKKWSTPHCTGTPPVPRHFHNTVVAGRRLFIFGGYDGIAWRNDIVALNLDTHHWEPVNCINSDTHNNSNPLNSTAPTTNRATLVANDAPSTLQGNPSTTVPLPTCPGPRASGSCVVLEGNKLLFFGGYNGEEFLNDMWILHTENARTKETEYRWEQIDPQSFRTKYKYKYGIPDSSLSPSSLPSSFPHTVNPRLPLNSSSLSPTTNNTTIPSLSQQPLTGNHANTHTNTMVTSNGNSNGNNGSLTVPLSTSTPTSASTNLLLPPPPAVAVRYPSLLYVGNVPLHLNIPVSLTLPHYSSASPNQSDLANAANNLYGGYGYWPAARSGHTAEVYGHLLLILGGRHKSGRFSDVLIYNLETGLWYEYITSGYSFIPRKTHAIGRINDRLWLFGGHDGQGWLGDLLMLDLQILRSLFTPVLTVPVPPTKFVTTLGRLLPDLSLWSNTDSNNADDDEANVKAKDNDDYEDDDDGADKSSDDGLWSQELLPHTNTGTTPNPSIALPDKLNSLSPWKTILSPSKPLSSVDDTSTDNPYHRALPDAEPFPTFSVPRNGSPSPPNTLSVATISNPVTTVNLVSSPVTSTPTEMVSIPSAAKMVEGTSNDTDSSCSTPSFPYPFASSTSSSPTFTDVTFLIDNQYRIRAHKSILSLRCEYFRVMFTSSFTEASTSSWIPLPDIDLETFTVFLRYLYTDTLPFSTETVSLSLPFNPVSVPLLMAAQRFTVYRLSRLCQRYIEANLSVDNACELFDFADNIGVRPLRRACVRYILDRYPLISRSPSFIQLRAELLRELLQRNAVNEEKRETLASIQYERMKLYYHTNYGTNHHPNLASPPAGAQHIILPSPPPPPSLPLPNTTNHATTTTNPNSNVL